MTRRLSPLALSYSVLSGPIVWFVHFMVVYAVAEFGCRANFNNQLFIAPQTIQLIVILSTLPALAAVAWGGWMAYQDWRSSERENSDSSAEPPAHFLVLLGMAFSVFFIVSIVFTVLPTFFLGVCSEAI